MKTAENVTQLYTDGDYLANHPDWHAERSPWKAQHVVRGLEATGLQPRSVCDIGCGTGLALSVVAQNVPSVEVAVGFEPSPDAPLHPEAKDVIEFRREDATESNEQFDASIMLDVFEHVEDYFGFLRACRPLADHHVFHIPLDANAKAIVGNGCMKARRAVGHLHYFTRQTALATLEDTGYEPIHWHYTKSAWDGPDRNPWSPASVMRRMAYKISPEYTQRILGGLALLVVAKANNGSKAKRVAKPR